MSVKEVKVVYFPCIFLATSNYLRHFFRIGHGIVTMEGKRTQTDKEAHAK